MEELAYAQTHAIEERHWWFVGMREIYRKQFMALPALERRRVLDVGCGTGGNLPLLDSLGAVWPLDASPSAARFTRDRGWSRIAVGSATELPYPDASFDLVTALGVIEHVPNDEAMLAEALRVVSPGGHLLVMTSAHPWMWSVHDDAVHHVRRYRRRELGERVARAGWTIEQITYVNAFLFPPIAAVRLAQKLLPRRRPDAERGMSGFHVPPSPINRALGAVFAAEGTLMRRMDLPMGVGLICRARRV